MKTPLKIKLEGHLRIHNIDTGEVLFDDHNDFNLANFKRMAASRLASSAEANWEGITGMEYQVDTVNFNTVPIDEYLAEGNEVTFITRIGPDFNDTVTNGNIDEVRLVVDAGDATNFIPNVDVNHQTGENLQVTWKVKYHLI